MKEAIKGYLIVFQIDYSTASRIPPGQGIAIGRTVSRHLHYVRLVDVVGMVDKLDLVCLDELAVRSYVV